METNENSNLETQEIIEYNTELEALNQIHNDLSILICFIVFFVVVIILNYAYKFFNMIFNF